MFKLSEDEQNVMKQAKEIEKNIPDWSRECEVCGETPVHPVTGMCGPCTFGSADTVGGNW